MLGTLAENDKIHWKDLVRPLVLTYNCTRNDRIVYSPYEFMDTASVDSESNVPPEPKVPPKALPRRRRSGISRLPSVAYGEAASSDEDTPSAKARSPRAQASAPKSGKGKEAASPVPTPETDKSAGALPDTRAPKPE
ncbi:hypothetical protein P4O66_003331 [Electrophorus voltai]|uniref:Uncharacterized protein n=1 Tax=Electrophorus voltai TaxID=2609070 RepID=A0AAD8YP28_9TELE|nr:hypothetical protein P4O66_003331 [Electrophorus voltai]